MTDNLTGLIWLKNANCNGSKHWNDALAWANGLHDGCSDCGGDNNDCGLSDHSVEGDWRLPNVLELVSLIDWRYINSALSNAAGTAKWSPDDAFTSVQSDYYWSSTARADNTNHAWGVYLYYGHVSGVFKTITYSVWPVRAGQ